MTTTTKFEVEKFDKKSNFLLWKMRLTSLLVKKGIHKTLLGIEKKPSNMENDEWNDIDFSWTSWKEFWPSASFYS